jgi:hypothetical protein
MVCYVDDVFICSSKKNTIIMFERASKTKMINDLEHVEQKFQQNEYKFIDLFL